MLQGKPAGQQTLRYKAAIIFALTSLLPLLLFLYVLNQKDLLQDTEAAGALALSVLIAVLGFVLFQQTVRSNNKSQGKGMGLGLSAILVDGSPRRVLMGFLDVRHRHPTPGGAAASGTPGVTAEARGPLATAQPWA